MSMTVQITMKGITDLEILLTALHEMGIETIRPHAKHRRRLLAPRQHVVRVPRHHRRTRSHQQRRLLY